MSGKNKLIVDLVIENRELSQLLSSAENAALQRETRCYMLEDEIKKLEAELTALRGEAITASANIGEYGPLGSEFNPDDFVAKLAEDNAKKVVK
jgi:hypothetical protein